MQTLGHPHLHMNKILRIPVHINICEALVSAPFGGKLSVVARHPPPSSNLPSLAHSCVHR